MSRAATQLGSEADRALDREVGPLAQFLALLVQIFSYSLRWQQVCLDD